MSQRKTLIAAIAAALLAALCAIIFIVGQAQSVANTQAEIIDQFQGGARRVLISRSRIETGTSIERNLFEEQTWPGICLPEGVIDAAEIEEYLGKRCTTTILAGEALSSLRLLDQQMPLDNLGADMTALTIPADDIHALGGEIMRGMRLNLMAGSSDGFVRLLASNIEVLSANTPAVHMGQFSDLSTDNSEGGSGFLGGSDGASTSFGSESLNWVTLAIPNNQVEQVLTASTLGSIHLVLPKTNVDALSLEDAQNEEVGQQ